MKHTTRIAIYGDGELTALANQIKEMTLEEMASQGLIDEGKAKSFMEENAIIVIQKGLLGSAIDKILSLFDTEGERHFKFVKLTS